MVDGIVVEELPEQEIQELPLPEGIEDTSVSEEQISGPDVEVQELQERMDNLGDVERNLVIEHLTPEIIQVLGIIGGQTFSDFFSEFSDPNRLLIPVDRNRFLSGDTQGTQQVSEEGILPEADLSTIRLPSEEEAP